MKLISVEASRVISLARIHATKGQPFAPEVLGALIGRYSFQKYPSTLDEILSDTKNFAIGKWGETQIDELGAYSDGLIASAKAKTDTIEAFVDDLYDFCLEQYGLERIRYPKETRLFESTLVVEMERDVTAKMAFMEGLNHSIEGFLSGYGLGDFEYRASGLQAEADATLHSQARPVPFHFARRIATPFEANYWYSKAPLKTDDHVAALEGLEKAFR